MKRLYTIRRFRNLALAEAHAKRRLEPRLRRMVEYLLDEKGKLVAWCNNPKNTP